MRKTILGILLVASLAGNAAFVITALAGSASSPVSVLDSLALTDDQEARFQDEQRSFEADRARARARMTELRGVMADELAKASPDREAMVRAALEMGDVQRAMRPRAVDHLLALHAVLTPVQRTALADAMRAAIPGATCPGAFLESVPDREGRPRQ
jgi:hypothetical protein